LLLDSIARFFTSKFSKTRTNVFSLGDKASSRALILANLETPETDASVRIETLLDVRKHDATTTTTSSSSSSSSMTSSSSSSSLSATVAADQPITYPPSLIVLHEIQQQKLTYPYEVLFRSMNQYFRDAVTSEYLFDLDFFGKVNLFDSIFRPSVQLFMVHSIFLSLALSLSLARSLAHSGTCGSIDTG
jgi:hypothetical protein